MDVQINSMSCDAARGLMSPFIDSMVSGEEANALRAHVEQCAPCGRQLQSFVSLRTLVAGVETAPVPEDLQLETRVRLSHERARRNRDRWQSRFDNLLKPFAVPAVMGISLTLLGFVILLGSLAKVPGVAMNNDLDDASLVGIYQPPRATDPTLLRLKEIADTDTDQVLSMQGEISDAGRIYDYSVFPGTNSPGVDQLLKEVVLLSQFRPATHWGLPVKSRVILSFVTVRG